MKYFFLIVSFCISQLLWSQNQSIFSARTIIPPSPNVGSLFKFEETQVSKFSGIPEISVPLYTIKGDRVDLPIGLRYHAGGVRVTEAASWVGMGWALQAGGVVTQSVRGLKDDEENGRFNTSTLTMNNLLSPTDCDLKAISDGRADSEPDIFNFSFNGVAGKFYLDDSKNIVQIPEQKIKIEAVATGTAPNYRISSWKFTNIDGVQYFFEEVELLMSSGKVLNGTTLLGDGDIGNYPQVAQKSWMLSRIVQTNGAIINFNYEAYNSLDFIYSSETKNFIYDALPNCPDGINFPTHTVNYQKQSVYQGKRLQSIVFPTGKVEFVTGSNRCDMYGDKFLDKVIVSDYKNQKIKEYRLVYKYFVGSTSYTTSALNCSSDAAPDVPSNGAAYNNYKDRRLFLTAVNEVDASANVAGSYSLEYENAIGLPNRFSAEQDWWGFYNGNGQTSLLQNIFQTNQLLDNIKRYEVYGRNPSLLYAKQGTLKKIIYPTGGSSEFEYELNSLTTTYGPTSVLHPEVNYSASGSSSGQLLGNLTVNHTGGSVSIPFKVDACTFGATTNKLVGFYITDLSNNVIISGSQVITDLQTATNGEVSYTLNNGSYKIYSFAQSSFPCTYNIKVKSWTDQPAPLDNYDNGGLRIKKITNSDNVTNTKHYKIYEYTELIGGKQISTGTLSIPVAKFRNEYVGWKSFCVVPAGGGNVEEKTQKFLALNSSTNYPLGSNQSGTIGYAKVIEKSIDDQNNDNGYTYYEFTAGQDNTFSDNPTYKGTNALSGSDKYPWTPVLSNESRGKALKVQHYLKQGVNNYKCIKSETYAYTYGTSYSSTNALVANYTLATNHPNITSSCSIGNPLRQFDGFRYNLYSLSTGYQLLSSVTTEETDLNNQKVTTSTAYEYNMQNFLPSKITTSNSLTGTNIQVIKYPKDYTSVTATDAISAGITALQNAYMIDQPVEKSTQRVVNSVNIGTASAVFSSYKASNLQPDKIYATEFTAPVTNFTSSSVASGAVTKDSRYQERVSFNLYDNTGNLVEQQLTNNIKQSYIWGYNNNYPIAEVKNAAVKDVFHTSFEDADGNSTTGDSKTGRLSRLNSYTKALTGLTNGNYLLTYWKKVSGAWALQSTAVTVSSTAYTISLTGQVDEVRFYPANAQITTYTFDPLIGITSQCDANNRLVYYQYDAFNRLSLVIDQDNNILKKYCYNYAGQAENCTYTLPMWQNTATAIRCKKDGNNQNMGDQEQEQKDMNPSSPTYNQLRWIVIGTNLTSCPIPPPCTGPDKMIINGVCVTGTKRYTASVWVPSEGKWSCKYKYTWQPDCVSSIDYYELKTSACTSAPACIPD